MDFSQITEESVDKSIKKILDLIESAKSQISKLQSETKSLESARSESIINLQQYKLDYDYLSESCQRFKELLDNNQLLKASEITAPLQASQGAPVAIQGSSVSIPGQAVPIQSQVLPMQSQILQQQMVPMQSQIMPIQQQMVQMPSQILQSSLMPMQQQVIQQQMMQIQSPMQQYGVMQQVPVSSSGIISSPRVSSQTIKAMESIPQEIAVKQEKNPIIEESVVPQAKIVASNSEDSDEPAPAEVKRVSYDVPVKEDIEYTVTSSDPFYKDGQHIRLLYSLSIGNVVCTTAISPNGDMFVFASRKEAFILNLEDGTLINKINILYDSSVKEYNTRCIRFTPDSTRIVVNHNSDVDIFDINTGRYLATLSGHKKDVSSFIFTNQGKTLVTCGHDCLICLWDMDTYKLIKKVEPPVSQPDDMIVSIAVDVEQTFITVAFKNGSIGIYTTDFEHPMHLSKTADSRIMTIGISPFDESIATGSMDSKINIYGFHGSLTQRTTLAEHTDIIITLAFKPAGHMLFSGSKDESIRAWDYKKGNCLFKIEPRKNSIFEISHHPTLNRFISCSGEGSVCLWEYDTQ